MNARLVKLWYDLQSSYYFIPGLMAVGAILLAWLTSTLDQHYNYEIAERLGWFYSNKADGARAVLTTIAGSMMTVASVTFSITMVAVTSAAGQYGPRLIGNFMRDKGNQITLGTFTATFVYCLLILRSARTGDTGTGENSVAEFVPNISLLVAMGLTLASVAVMIYFIHHIPETLNVGNITGRVGRRLRRDIRTLFSAPDDLSAATPKASDEDTLVVPTALPFEREDRNAIFVGAHAEGYIQAVDEALLISFACERNIIIELLRSPGDFVIHREPLLKLSFNGPVELDEADHKALRNAFANGQERTEHQNVMFLADELVEILARALSPGINDPFTAINCLHWFKSAINAAMQGESRPAYRPDANGVARLIINPLTFEAFVTRICERIRPYVCRDRNVSLEMLDVLGALAMCCDNLEYKACLKVEHAKVKEAALQGLKSDVERQEVDAVANL